MTRSISIYAGASARKTLESEGLKPQIFDAMVGASGGPKWFTLFGLDKYIFGEFFKDRQDPIYTLGTSAGAWRMACFAQKDPVAAIGRLAEHYSHETYTPKADVTEISDKGEIMLQKLLGEYGAKEIASNPTIQTHFILARSKGISRSESRLLQSLGLLNAAVANSFSRQNLKHFFDRFVFHTQSVNFQQSHFRFDDLPTEYATLTGDNLAKALMATGSIPLVLRGVKDIPQAPDGVYRDGGIVDYHLDLDFATQGLVLYPHFFPVLKPGWFDKGLKSRHANAANLDKTVIITPSPEHIARLPFGKISDRKDFQTMQDEQRIDYWQTVLAESHRMADDFADLVENGIPADTVKPVEDILK